MKLIILPVERERERERERKKKREREKKEREREREIWDNFQAPYIRESLKGTFTSILSLHIDIQTVYKGLS